MPDRFEGLGAAFLILMMASPVLAQDPGCSDFKWPVDREKAAFSSGTLPIVATGASLPPVSQAAALTLSKQDSVTFATTPTHQPKHDPAFAGTFELPPPATPGSYQVTVSDEAWIDVAQNGKLLKQTGFTGSHTCPLVRKSVRFDLADGPITVEISDATRDAMKIEVLPAAGP